MQNRTTTEEKHPAHRLPNQRFLEVYQLPDPGISDAGKIKTVGPRATTEMCSGSRPRKTATA
jgi:hypothetical protein